MNCPWEVIANLESDNSRLFKEAVVLEEAKNSNIEFFDGVKLALSPLVTFGLKQIPIKDGADGNGLTWEAFNHIATKFINRELTGNVARQAVIALMNTATKDQWNLWYRRILIKDLRCGVSEKTINNVVKKSYKDYTIPIFTVQLAHDGKDHQSKLVGKKLIESKGDGARCITVVYPNRVDQFSRNGKELLNFDHIKSQFLSVASTLTEPFVFDGEVMSKDFQDLMKQIHRKENVNAKDASLILFDMFPLKDFNAGICKIAQSKRSFSLKQWYDANKDKLPNVQLFDQEEVNLSTEDGRKRFNEINKAALDANFEGIMIKDPDAPYELKRSTAWLKMKPVISVDLTIIGIERGTGRHESRLGAFVCEGMDSGRLITVNVGSGFSDEDRDEFWKNKDEMIGMIVEVEADAITQNQDGTYSLRFPRFKRLRGFNVGEKI